MQDPLIDAAAAPGFTIPSTAVEVTLRLDDGTPQPGSIFVSARVPHHSGPETPLELLNRPEPFFAFRPADGSGVLFIAKGRTLAVSVPGAPLDDPDRLEAARRLSFELVLADGSNLSGWATAELPVAHARPLDYLNASREPFFTLATESNTHCVNRAHVRYARPQD